MLEPPSVISGDWSWSCLSSPRFIRQHKKCSCTSSNAGRLDAPDRADDLRLAKRQARPDPDEAPRAICSRERPGTPDLDDRVALRLRRRNPALGGLSLTAAAAVPVLSDGGTASRGPGRRTASPNRSLQGEVGLRAKRLLRCWRCCRWWTHNSTAGDREVLAAQHLRSIRDALGRWSWRPTGRRRKRHPGVVLSLVR